MKIEKLIEQLTELQGEGVTTVLVRDRQGRLEEAAELKPCSRYTDGLTATIIEAVESIRGEAYGAVKIKNDYRKK